MKSPLHHCNALNAELLPEEQLRIERRPTRKLAVLDAYYLGKAKWLDGDLAGLQAAISVKSAFIESECADHPEQRDQLRQWEETGQLEPIPELPVK